VLYHFTPVSSNAKTGPIPVSTTSAESCPPTCPFISAGCYAKSGPLALHWNKVTQGARGGSLEELCAAVVALPANQLWRHNQAGDLPGQAGAIDAAALRALVAANVGRRGFTYTHKPVLTGKTAAANRKAIRAANARGFTVNLSANTLAQADELAALDIGPVAAVVPQDTLDKFTTPGGLPGVVCPAQTRENINCARCGLCARQERRDLVIGFRPHGTGAKKADAVARG
jgi:hypothetical protein